MNNKRKMLMGIFCVVILIFVIILTVFFINGPENEKYSKNLGSNQDSNIITELYPEDMESIDIKTPYCNLLYPKKWKSNLKTELKQYKKRYVVRFLAKIEGKKDIPIFDIVFGGEGDSIGIIKSTDGKKVNISVKFYEFEGNDTLNEGDKETIYMMCEDINYIIYKLEKVDGFEVAK